MTTRNQPHQLTRLAEPGAWLMTVGSTFGLFAALIDYFWRGDGIAYTSGVLLVIVSSALLLGASLSLAIRALGGALTVAFVVLAGLDILATGFAAWMLEANWLLGLMTVAAAGWIINVFFDAPAESTVRAYSPRLQESAR
jgi:hypothetical protein